MRVSCLKIRLFIFALYIIVVKWYAIETDGFLPVSMAYFYYFGSYFSYISIR